MAYYSIGFVNYVSMHAFQANITQNPKGLLVTMKYYIIVGLKTNLLNFFFCYYSITRK